MVMLMRKLSSLTVWLIFVRVSSAQTASDLVWVNNDSLFTARDNDSYASHNSEENLAPQRVGTDIISLYQFFISSQDRPSCIFEPSCSHYGQLALQKLGLVEGILSTADRFLRCNGWGEKPYNLDAKTNKFIDPP